MERAGKSKWSGRLIASAVLAAAVVAISVATSIAAPPGPTASADDDGASSSALGAPGTLTISESHVGHEEPPNWSAVSVAGTSVIGKGPQAGATPTNPGTAADEGGDPEGGDPEGSDPPPNTDPPPSVDQQADWNGAAAALGPTIDQLNIALCPSPIPLDERSVLAVCVALLPGYATTSFNDAGVSHSEAGGSLAQLGAAVVRDDNTLIGGGLDVLPSSAAESGPECPLSSSVAGLLTIALGTGGTDIQRMTLGLEEALAGGCVGGA